MNGYRSDECSQIREVWAANLEEEFERIRDVVEHFQYIAMDTEFPGVVARPTGNVTEYNYQTVKCNVDLLKVIQLGITFADSRGNLAKGTCTWQFNFRFDLGCDMYAQDSIDFLKQSGIDFEKQQKEGIDLQDFGEIIMSSGLVMNEDVKWISFHGCYDFGYLLKLLTCAPLPDSEAQFFELLHDFFPALYDIKYLLRNIRGFNLNGRSSLQKIAEHLNVERVGQQHQAGSDSLVTCRTFFKLMEFYFDNQIDDALFSGVIYGLGAASAPKHVRGGDVADGAGGSAPPLQQQGAGGSGAVTTSNSQVSSGSGSSGGGLGGSLMVAGISGGPASHAGATSNLQGGGGLLGYGAHLSGQQQLGTGSAGSDVIDPNGLRKLLGHLQQPAQSHKLLSQPQQQAIPNNRPPPLGPVQQQQLPPHALLFNGFEGGAGGGGGAQVGIVPGSVGGVVVPPSSAGVVGSAALPGHSATTSYHQTPSQTSPPLSHLQQQAAQGAVGGAGGQGAGGAVLSPFLPHHHPLAHAGTGGAVGCPSGVPGGGGGGAVASAASTGNGGGGGGAGGGQTTGSGVVAGGPGGGGGGSAGLHFSASGVKQPVLGGAAGGPPPVNSTAGPLAAVSSGGVSPARQQPHGPHQHHHPQPPPQQLHSPPQVLPHLHFAPMGAGTINPQDQQQQVLGDVGPSTASGGGSETGTEGRGALPPSIPQQQLPWGPQQACGGNGLVHGAWSAASGSIPPPQRPPQQFSASSYDSSWGSAAEAGGADGT